MELTVRGDNNEKLEGKRLGLSSCNGLYATTFARKTLEPVLHQLNIILKIWGKDLQSLKSI